VRVLANAAQHIPVLVRTIMVVLPGRLPLCHQLPAPSGRAYFSSEFCGEAGEGVAMIRIVSGFSKTGIVRKAAQMIEKSHKVRKA